MNSHGTCSKCGVRLPARSASSFCPACLYQEIVQPLPTADTGSSATTDASSHLALPVEPAEVLGGMIGRYKLLEKLGEGGFGTVWAAEQREPVKRRVALKIIKLGMDTKQVIARFEAERQALALMDHPNIAKVLDGGATESGRPYFVMELVRGVSITTYCDEAKLGTTARLNLFVKVCQAIQHAHQKGIIHRDIKPSNILVTLHDGEPVPKVIDFGIAKATQQELTERTIYTQHHQFIGTPAYMSPEQAELSGLDIDTRSDIYSLGVLLYELLTGLTPFDGKELVASGLDAMRRTIREQDPPRPSTRLAQLEKAEGTTTTARRHSDVPRLVQLLRGDLDWIVMKCLEKDRARRYETANGLAADIGRHLNNAPVLARPPTAAYRLQKFWRRNKLPCTAGAAVFLALTLGLTLSTRSYFKERSARERAVAAEQMQARLRKEAELQRRDAENERARAEKESRVAKRNSYAASMLLARKEWDGNNLEGLQAILGETADYPDRGFEWYYWQRMCHQEFKILRDHMGAVSCLDLSPDGRWLASGSADQTIRIWDTETWQQPRALRGHADTVYSVAISPDGRRIASASNDRTVRLWDFASGRLLFTLKGHVGSVRSVQFSPDGTRLASGATDGQVKMWEVSSGRELATLQDSKDGIFHMAFLQDGKRLVTCSPRNVVRIWDTESGRELPPLNAHKDGEAVGVMAVASLGNRLATGSTEGRIAVWDTETLREICSFEPGPGHFNTVALAFSRDGQMLVSSHDDRVVRTWDLESRRKLSEIKGHPKSVEAVAFLPGARSIITGSSDRSIRIWRTEAEGNQEVPGAPLANAWCVVFSPDGRQLAMGITNQIQLRDVGTGAVCREFPHEMGTVPSLAYSPDGTRIVAGGYSGAVKIWETDTGRETRVMHGHAGAIWSVAFSPDGEQVASGASDLTVRLWNARTGEEVRNLRGHTGTVALLRFSPNGHKLYSGSWDQTIRIWEVATGHVLHVLEGHERPLGGLAISADGRWILSGDWSGMTSLWDAETGERRMNFRGQSQGGVLGTAFSPDGHRFATAGVSGMVKLWDSESGRELLTLEGDCGGLAYPVFSPDGRRIAANCRSERYRHWTCATAEEVASWKEAERKALDEWKRSDSLRSLDLESQLPRHGQALGLINDWLILASFPAAGENLLWEELRADHLQGEASLRPKPGDRAMIHGRELTWQAGRFPSGIIDFNEFLGRLNSYCGGYAVTYVKAPNGMKDLRLKVASDDQSRVFVNGQLVYEQGTRRNLWNGRDTVAGIELKAGLNVIVLKVMNGQLEWNAALSLTDPQGNPITGVEVTLQPE